MPMSFEELERVYKKWLDLDADPDLLRLIISIPIANRLEGNPVWVLVIGKSGSGKSQLLGGMKTAAEVVNVDSLTPASILSAYYQDGVNDSLLYRANGKTAIVKDFSPILLAHADNRNAVFSLLRAAYDGYVERLTGKGTLSWTGKIGMIAALTPALERQREKEPMLGERFINIRTRVDDSDALLDTVFSGTTKRPERDNEIQEATANYLNNFPTPQPPHVLPVVLKPIILGVARSLARARAGADRDGYSKEIGFPVEVHEVPTRLVTQFSLLALACKYTGASPEYVTRIIIRMMHDGIPYTRLTTLKMIARFPNLTQQELATRVGISQPTMSRSLEEMLMLKIVTKSKGWEIPDEYIRRAAMS